MPTRARDLGIVIGDHPTGPQNAITDVPGVRVAHTTLVEGEGDLKRGYGPIRTGVTLVEPRPDVASSPVFAGFHRLNGNGEMTGLQWIKENGALTTPIGLTNSHSVGVVRDAIVARLADQRPDRDLFWLLPVVAETWDGILNDINGQHVRAEHVHSAFDELDGGAVAEGGVGGGTGMICHEFKGGIGTSSRRLAEDAGGYTVGVLVQANYGRRARLRINGAPVGERIGTDVTPSPYDGAVGLAGSGSIIVVVATDAPLLPHQCDRLAQRAALGIGRMGGTGEHGSGDLVLSFATGNTGLPPVGFEEPGGATELPVRMVTNPAIDPLFDLVIEATEEAIVNALVAADTTVGRDGLTAHALDHDLLRSALGLA
ncbi:P1 family peptidase [Nocardioides sp. YIM 152588]|uniref:DmpA family aminopeptidase n=1 Tax=Nocardioides sp. YIM 152588 TaxID=3158259 RepID=UPI0032E43B22